MLVIQTQMPLVGKVNYSIKKDQILKRNKVLDYIFEFCGRSSTIFLLI